MTSGAHGLRSQSGLPTWTQWPGPERPNNTTCNKLQGRCGSPLDQIEYIQPAKTSIGKLHATNYTQPFCETDLYHQLLRISDSCTLTDASSQTSAKSCELPSMLERWHWN